MIATTVGHQDWVLLATALGCIQSSSDLLEREESRREMWKNGFRKEEYKDDLKVICISTDYSTLKEPVF